MKENPPIAENFLETIKSHTLEQYKSSKALTALISALVAQLQEVENTFLDLQLKRFILTAFGTTLDYIGEIVGEYRNFRADDDYRVAILVKAVVNSGGGTPEDIIAMINILYTPRLVELKEAYPASFSLFIWESLDILPEVQYPLRGIGKLIDSIKPLGVKKASITAASGDQIFRCSESTSELLDFLVNSQVEEVFDINSDGGTSALLVEADTVSDKADSFGFAELLHASQQIVGGGTLAEVLRYA
jgi:hypothetical protein